MSELHTKIRFKENLRNILNANDISNKEFALLMDVAPSAVTSWLNGRTFPKEPETLVKIASFFGISLEILLSGDTKKMIVMESDWRTFGNNIFTLLPVFASCSKDDTPLFDKACDYHRIILETEKTNRLIDQREIGRAVGQSIEYYSLSAEQEKISQEVYCANQLSLLTILIMNGRTIANLSKYRNKDMVGLYPLSLSRMIEEDPRMKKRFEALETVSEFEDIDVLYRKAIRDPEIISIYEEALNCLKAKKRWSDLAYYYECLRYVSGFVENAYSYELNHEMGFELLMSFARIGNVYAKQYIDIMGFSRGV